MSATLTATNRPRVTPPTARQMQVLRALDDCRHAAGIPPTLRQLAERLSCNVHAVQQHLSALERKRLITRDPRRARSAVLTAAALLLLEGWRDGAPPTTPGVCVDIDTAMAAEMACGGCGHVGLAFAPMHRDAGEALIYGGLYECPVCRTQEAA